MSEILESLSDPRLIPAAEAAYQMAMNYLGRTLAATFYQEPEATWFITEPVEFNKVIHTAFTRDTPESTIDRTLKRIAASAAGGSVMWDIGPSLLNARLEACLQANGWSKNEEILSMVLDIHSVKRPVRGPAALTIKQVTDEETFKHFTDVTITGFELPEPLALYMSGVDFGDELLHDPAAYYYVGYVQGKPVTTSLVLLSAGVAEIGNIATIPQMRRQGLATAMTLAALQQARGLGYHIAVLQATEMGIPVYHRLGFQDHFTFASYSYSPNPQQDVSAR